MKTTYSTSVASSGSSGLLVVILIQILDHWHITIPPDAAAALAAALTAVVHYLSQWLPEPPDRTPKPAEAAKT